MRDDGITQRPSNQVSAGRLADDGQPQVKVEPLSDLDLSVCVPQEGQRPSLVNGISWGDGGAMRGIGQGRRFRWVGIWILVGRWTMDSGECWKGAWMGVELSVVEAGWKESGLVEG